jgi:N-acyl homoserine lactone hydrolase
VNIHAIKTGEVTLKTRQCEGSRSGTARRLATMTDREWSRPLPIYAWVIEHPEGLIVVDTGQSARASKPGYFPRWHPYFRTSIKAQVEPHEEIGPQLAKLGLSPHDVRWVVMTHLHSDHAAGMDTFHHGETVVSAAELRQASGSAGRARGYLPQHWPEGFRPTKVAFRPERFGVFSESQPLTLDRRVWLVPTPGHTRGHMSVIVEEDDGRAVFLAGDASYSQDLMLREAVDGVSPADDVARRTLRTIREFVTSRPTVYLPSHDPDSAERLEARETVPLSPAPADEPMVAA